MTQTYKNALDNSLSYDEKVRLMTLAVLREESGRETQKRCRYADQEFDWKEYNEKFNCDYGNCTQVELLKLCKEYYGLNGIDDIRKKRQQHKEQYARVSAKYKVA